MAVNIQRSTRIRNCSSRHPERCIACTAPEQARRRMHSRALRIALFAPGSMAAMYARELSTRDIEATFADAAGCLGRPALSRDGARRLLASRDRVGIGRSHARRTRRRGAAPRRGHARRRGRWRDRRQRTRAHPMLIVDARRAYPRRLRGPQRGLRLLPVRVSADREAPARVPTPGSRLALGFSLRPRPARPQPSSPRRGGRT